VFGSRPTCILGDYDCVMWRKEEEEEDDDHLVIGSSQGFVIGYDAKNIESLDFSCTLRYAYPAHEKSIRCIAGSYPTVATASADESIKVYQLDQLQEVSKGRMREKEEWSVDVLV
jgi:WD40 repeat protein